MEKVYNIQFKIISARFGSSKEKLAEDPNYKFRIYFSRKNDEKQIIENASTAKVQLKDSLMYFNNELISFSDISIPNDRVEISFVLLKDTVKRYKPLIIYLKNLVIGSETEGIWTLSSQSLINLTYHITCETRRRHIYEDEEEFDMKTSLDTAKYLKQNGNEPNIDLFKTHSTQTLTSMIPKLNQTSSINHLTKTPAGPQRVNTFLSSVSRNSPQIDKTRSFLDKNIIDKNQEKKFEIATSLFQKSFQNMTLNQNDEIALNYKNNNNPNNSIIVNSNSNNNSKDFELVEARDISASEHNNSSMIGNNTTNNSSNPMENYDTFIQAIFVSGLSNEISLEKIDGSDEFIAPCGHKECSFLPAFKPRILQSYINKNAQPKPEINNIVANVGFPVGIKLCYYCVIDKNKKCNHIPKPQQSFINVMKNEKNELFYISTHQYFVKVSIKDFEASYKMNPLKEYASNNPIIPQSAKTRNGKEDKDKGQEMMRIISELMVNDTVLIPESVSLVSKYPYFEAMDTCLKTIISLPKEEMIALITHIVNEVPIPNKDQLVLFYVPRTSEAVKIFSPTMTNNESVSQLNYKSIFKYFSAENICLIFQLILLEQKILFVHNNYQELSEIVFLFINLIYPISWVNPYIPVLNISTVEFIQTIVPFVMGIDESLLKYADKKRFLNQGEIVMIYIDKDALILNKNKKKTNRKTLLKDLNLPELPEKISEYLLTELKIIKKTIIKDGSALNGRINDIFIRAMIMLVGDYKSFTFMTNEDMPLFNKEGFISNHQNKDMKSFLTELTATQIFNQFLFNEKLISHTSSRNVNKCLGDSPTIGSFDTSYFMQMIPKCSGLINVQQVKKRSNSVSNRHESSKGSKIKSIPNHINSSFHTASNDTNIAVFKNTAIPDEKQKTIHNKIKTFLLFPYFISNPLVTLDKKKIEDYITSTLKKKGVNDINAVDQHCFIISNQKGYQLSNLPFKRRYYLNSPIHINTIGSSLCKSAAVSPDQRHEKEEVKATSLFSIELFDCAKNNTTNNNPIKKSESAKNLNKKEIDDQMISINNQTILDDCFKNICTSKKKISNNQFEQINYLLQSANGRNYLAKLIFPDETIANEENHKQLTIPSYEDFYFLIKTCLNFTKNTEYIIGRLLTLSCFSYYKIEKTGKVKYIYEDMVNEAYPTTIWIQEEFWLHFCIEEANELNTDDVYHIEEKIIAMADIMFHLKLNKNFTKKVVIEQCGKKMLPKTLVEQLELKLFTDS